MAGWRRLKVRIGVSLAGTTAPAGAFGERVDELEERGIDSLWLSELVYSPLVDPFIGMAYALSRTRKLKVGTGVAVLPGRSPILVAKQLASLARLAPKRVLPVFGLSPARPAERVAFPVPKGQRGAVFDESLELLRRLLREPRCRSTAISSTSMTPPWESCRTSRSTSGSAAAPGGPAPDRSLRRRLARQLHHPGGGRRRDRRIKATAAEAGREIDRITTGSAFPSRSASCRSSLTLHQDPPCRCPPGSADSLGVGRGAGADRALHRRWDEQVRGSARPAALRPGGLFVRLLHRAGTAADLIVAAMRHT